MSPTSSSTAAVVGVLAVAVLLGAAPARAADKFTSAAAITGLFQTEVALVEKLESLIEEEEARLASLRSYVDDFRAAVEAKRDVRETFVVAEGFNPGESFQIFNRMVRALATVSGHLRPPPRAVEQWLTEHEQAGGLLPTANDLEGAAAAMLRLQRTYNRPARTLLVGGSSDDFFVVGKLAYDQEDWRATHDWMQASLDLLLTDHPDVLEPATADAGEAGQDVVTMAANNGTALPAHTPPQARALELLDYLSFAAFKAGQLAEAKTLGEQYLRLHAGNFRMQDNVDYYSRLLARGVPSTAPTPEPTAGDDAGAGEQTDEAYGSYNYAQDNLLRHPEVDMVNYRSLCRREPVPDLPVPTNESCRFDARGRPELLLSPPAVEQLLSTTQDVKIFRDFLTPEECDHIIATAAPRMTRSTTYNGSVLKPSDYRISQVAWLRPDTDDTILAIHRRIRLATGIDINTAEDLQVSNYGLGGHYEPHYDYGSGRKGDHFERNGNRLATLMVYLTDVEEGGSTVFPRLGVGVRPKRGDAIFWLNLQPSGDGEPLTLHGACPVLSGSKWVANKWFHQRGNHELVCAK